MKHSFLELGLKQKGFRRIFFCLSICSLLILMVSLLNVGHAKAQSIGVSWVKIKDKKFDFDGWVSWRMNEGKISPSLHGDLDAKDAKGLCGRMRMDFYGGAHIFLIDSHGGSKCPDSKKRLRYEIDLIPYQNKSDEIRYESNKVNEIKVSIEKKTKKKGWVTVGSETVKLIPLRDKVKISRRGFDFGGKGYVAGGLTSSGEVIWTWGEGKVTPRVTGRLHLNKVASACARLQIKYFTFDEVLLTTKAGEKVCASTNQHYARDVDFSPYSDGKIAYITVHLQSLRADGSWDSRGGATERYVNPNVACQGKTRKPCSVVVGG